MEAVSSEKSKRTLNTRILGVATVFKALGLIPYANGFEDVISLYMWFAGFYVVLFWLCHSSVHHSDVRERAGLIAASFVLCANFFLFMVGSVYIYGNSHADLEIFFHSTAVAVIAVIVWCLAWLTLAAARGLNKASSE